MGKIRKSTLSILLFPLIAANASNFNVIIDNNKNSYDYGKIVTEESEWEVVGNISCSFDVESSEVYYNIDFTQTENCIKNLEKTIVTKKVVSNGSEEIIDVNKQTKTEYTTTSSEKQGTHLESTCNDIKNFNSDLTDGEYVIYQSENVTVYCDMTRDGGGWMRVANYDWYSNKTAPNSSFDSTSGKSIRDTQGVDRLLIDAFWVKGWLQPAGTTGQRWASVDIQPLYDWTDAIIEFEALAFRSLDGYHPSINLSTNVQGQYIDGFSFTFGENNSRTHIYSVPVGHGTDTAVKEANLGWLKESELSYMFQTDQELGYTYNAMEEFIINYSGKSPSKDMLSMRLMADQHYEDETIGFRKFIVYVK